MVWTKPESPSSTNMRWYIREATALDAPRLAELEQVFPNAMTEAMVARELEAGKGWVILDGTVLESSPVVGYALVRDDGVLLDLTRLAVEARHRGLGAGELLLKHVLITERPVMLTVKKDNHRAIRLYLKHGFEVVAHFTEADAWAMRREPVAADRQAAG